MTATLMTKMCRGCDQVLPASAFYPCPSKSTGITSRCKECLRVGHRLRHQARRPEALAKMRAYYQADYAIQPEKWNQRVKDRRAAKKAGGRFVITEADWRAVVRRHGGLCAYCKTSPWTERDHVVPLSRGGRHAIGNLLPACVSCNRSKGPRTITEWRAAA